MVMPQAIFLPPSPQDLVPTLRDLCLLPVPNWYLLGLQLGVSGDELDMIERNYPRDNNLCKVKMFGAWLRMDTSGTYEKLVRALVAVGMWSSAEAVCSSRGMRVPVVVCYSLYCAMKGSDCSWMENITHSDQLNVHVARNTTMATFHVHMLK